MGLLEEDVNWQTESLGGLRVRTTFDITRVGEDSHFQQQTDRDCFRIWTYCASSSSTSATDWYSCYCSEFNSFIVEFKRIVINIASTCKCNAFTGSEAILGCAQGSLITRSWFVDATLPWS